MYNSGYEITTFPPATGTGTGGTGSTTPITYTNATPTPTTIGGIPSGSTFSAATMTAMWNALLYPYQVPSFTSFSSTLASVVEVGTTIPAGPVTFSWATANPANIAPSSLAIDDITNVTSLATGLSNTGSATVTTVAITKATAASHHWRLSGTDVKGATISRTLSVAWQWRMYYGESPLTTVTEADIKALRINTLANSFGGSYNLAAGGYKWFCYPTSLGLKTTFKDTSTNLNVAMEPATTVAVTNANGITTNYYCHRTFNILGGTITIAVS